MSPIHCIHEGPRALYIHPDECGDCGVCEPVSPVAATYYGDVRRDPWSGYLIDSAVFFEGNPEPGELLCSPGEAARLGVVDGDIPTVAPQPEGVAP